MLGPGQVRNRQFGPHSRVAVWPPTLLPASCPPPPLSSTTPWRGRFKFLKAWLQFIHDMVPAAATPVALRLGVVFLWELFNCSTFQSDSHGGGGRSAPCPALLTAQESVGPRSADPGVKPMKCQLLPALPTAAKKLPQSLEEGKIWNPREGLSRRAKAATIVTPTFSEADWQADKPINMDSCLTSGCLGPPSNTD